MRDRAQLLFYPNTYDMPTTAARPADRTPTFAYICLFAIQFLIEGLVRIAFINDGLFIGLTVPPANSPELLTKFVAHWNVAMSWASPVLAFVLAALVFGLYVIVTYGRFATGGRIRFSLANSFHMGLRGFIAPGVAALGVAVLTRGNPMFALLPAALNLAVFWRFSRHSMWHKFCQVAVAERSTAGKDGAR
jgi:hypothetical protein